MAKGLNCIKCLKSGKEMSSRRHLWVILWLSLGPCCLEGGHKVVQMRMLNEIEETESTESTVNIWTWTDEVEAGSTATEVFELSTEEYTEEPETTSTKLPPASLTPAKCPKVKVMQNVKKKRLLGTWFAYGTTPLKSKMYKRRCASYNVKDSPYFKTNILYTDYSRLVVTYSCGFDEEVDSNYVKIRVLTRTRTPMERTLVKAREALATINISPDSLVWLKTDAYCFEWYELNFELYPRPKVLGAPFNQPGELR